MMLRHKILMIVNPISGKGRKQRIEALQKLIEESGLDISLQITTYAGEGEKIASIGIKDGIKHFIAVGGDGTVNEIGRAIYLTPETSLGIIPSGSGNGLAKHLKLPISIEKAFKIATGEHKEPCDVGILNEIPFFSIAGIGFDAKIAHDFSEMSGRGLKNYVKSVIKNYPKYKTQKYKIKIEDKVFSSKALFISLANSNQFGSNASIAPQADLKDGLIDICIMRKIPIGKALLIFPLLFMKRMHRTKYLDIIKAPEAVFYRKKGGYIHIDGDPHLIHEKVLTLSLKEKALNIHV
ncbi:MAG: YegS/Rv2252/BmrU family lipid kinase [Bacteroidales bacterium]|nr:YegS/Rv2252/BmrU family lipid kinase [Bacteroidales bacterium]